MSQLELNQTVCPELSRATDSLRWNCVTSLSQLLAGPVPGPSTWRSLSESTEPVNYIDTSRKCCVQGKGEMWRFLNCLECLYNHHKERWNLWDSKAAGGCVKVTVIPKMFNKSNLPTVVFDSCDSQLRLKTRENLGFFESQLIAFGPEGLRVLHSSEV
jgi:hypothetical protein